MSAHRKLRFKDPIRAEQDQARCNAILEVIFCDPITGSINQEGKEALKEECNRLSRELEDLRCGPLGDPLAVLPLEMWTAIIQEATRENGANLSPIDALLVFTLVSTEWRAKILGNSLLWTELAIGRGEADAQAKLETALFLSGNSLLNLLIHTRQFRLDVDLPLLQPHAERIKEIIFQPLIRMEYNSSYELADFAVIDRIFSEIDQFSKLAIITWNEFSTNAQLCPDFPLILKKSPVLTRIYGIKVPFEIVRCRAGTPLRSYMIREASSTILRYVDDLGDVEELTLMNHQMESNSYRGDTSPLSLPALRSLRRAEMDASFISLLKRADNLNCLEITIKDKWQTLTDLFENLDQLPRLTVLDLFLSKMTGKLEFHSATGTNTRVQDLKITCAIESIFEEKEGETISNEQTLFKPFRLLFSEVRNLTLCFVTLCSDFATYIRSISQLQSLRLKRISLHSAISIESSSLENLVLDGNWENDIKHFMSTTKCPRLSRLQWNGADHTIQEGIPSLLHDRDESSAYMNIQTLYINSSQARWMVPRFHALEKLHVDEGSFSMSELFIQEPSACPSLREIHLGFVPEWDLLFIMLERRNYLPPSQRVTRIQTLILPYPVSSSLMAPLVEILSGRFTERPSNDALSFCGFMDAYFDPSISGCTNCLRSMRSCAAPLGASEGMPLSHPSFSISRRHAMPTEIREWLRGRKDRLARWKAHERDWIKSGHERVDICAEFWLAQQPFTIGAGFTSVGLSPTLSVGRGFTYAS